MTSVNTTIRTTSSDAAVAASLEEINKAAQAAAIETILEAAPEAGLKVKFFIDIRIETIQEYD